MWCQQIVDTWGVVHNEGSGCPFLYCPSKHYLMLVASFPGLHAQLLSLAVSNKSCAWRPGNEARMLERLQGR